MPRQYGKHEGQIPVLTAYEVGMLTAYVLEESFMPLSNLEECIQYPTRGLDRWRRHVTSEKAVELATKGNLPFFLKQSVVPDFLKGLIDVTDELGHDSLDEKNDDACYRIGRAMAMEVRMDMSNFNDLVFQMSAIMSLARFINEDGLATSEARALIQEISSVPTFMNHKELSRMYMGFVHQMVERRRQFFKLS